MSTSVIHIPRPDRNAWPLSLVLIVAMILGAVLWMDSDGAATASPDGLSGQSMPASHLVVTVLVTATQTRTPQVTQTARVLIVTPTMSATPSIPFCTDAMTGQTCIRFAVAIPTAAPRYCSQMTPTSYSTQLCRKDAPVTGSEAETQ